MGGIVKPDKGFPHLTAANPYNGSMARTRHLALILLAATAIAGAQSGKNEPPRSQEPPRSDLPSGVSSSNDTKVPLSDVTDDSEAAEPDPSVTEAKRWDPHRAAKSIEVGDYYMRRKNYRAAESRYREALEYKPNDAVATFKLGQVMEKQGNLTLARQNYEAYLKMLPAGPLSGDARKGLARIEKDGK
jgi:tetratricopeptide (TPR) repeat protein